MSILTSDLIAFVRTANYQKTKRCIESQLNPLELQLKSDYITHMHTPTHKLTVLIGPFIFARLKRSTPYTRWIDLSCFQSNWTDVFVLHPALICQLVKCSFNRVQIELDHLLAVKWFKQMCVLIRCNQTEVSWAVYWPFKQHWVWLLIKSPMETKWNDSKMDFI